MIRICPNMIRILARSLQLGYLKNQFFIPPCPTFGRCLQKRPRYEGMEAELYHRVAWWVQ